MKLWETFRFEVAYQSRRVSTWFYFVLFLGITFHMAREVFVEEAREGGYFLNAPFAVAQDPRRVHAVAAGAGGGSGRRGTWKRGCTRSSTPRPSARPPTSAGGSSELMWLVVPLLIVYYAGEMVWREREAGLSEIAGAAPVPVWVSFAGKFAGLTLVLAAMQALMTAAAMIVQARMGYYEFEVGLYARILFGIRLTDYLLFALLTLVVQVVVDQKYVGHAIAVAAYALTAFGSQLGIESTPLLYGSDPGWTYSDIRGLDPFLGPWLLFKLYWAAWALLLVVAAKLLWPRGTERGLGPRLRLARCRLTRRTAGTAAAAAALVLTFGGLIVYNTSVLYASHAAPRRPRGAHGRRRARSDHVRGRRGYG